MKITGSHHYPHPRERVWEALLDPDVLSRTLPGCEDLRQTGDHEFSGELKMKVGPVQGNFRGKVTLSDLDPPSGYHLDLQGQGAPGFVKGAGDLRLEERDGGTELHYDIDAQVGGRIASVGQRLLDSSAKVITKQGLTGLGVQLDALAAAEAPEPKAVAEAERPEEDEASDSPTRSAPAAPSQAEFAAEFARGMADELVPRSQRPWLLLLVLIAAVAALALFLRACP